MAIRRKSLIFILSGLVVIFALIFVFIAPLASNLMRLNKDINDQKITLEITKKRAQNVTVLVSDYDQIKNYQTEISKFFINNQEQLIFLTSLENIAQKNNLVQGLTLDEIGEINKIKEVPLQISLTGNYLDILKYLAGVENLGYYVNIQSITFSKPSNNTNSQNNITSVIQSKTYWQQL